MPPHHLQPIHIRVFRTDIALPVFKDADKTNIVKISWQIRLNIFKIPQMNRYIPAILMAVCIDKTPLF